MIIDNPKVFLHYSWDDELHKKWVLNLAERLVSDGIDVFFDRFDLQIGSNNNYFMERIIEADKVLVIMTEKYKIKADTRTGGVGYEYQIVSSEISKDIVGTNRFLPILKSGSKNTSVPIVLQSYLFLDMQKEDKLEEQYLELLRAICNKPSITKPQLGKLPNFDTDILYVEKHDSTILKLGLKRVEVRTILGNPQEEESLVENYWNEGIQVYFNRHDDFVDGFIYKRLPSGVQFDGDVLGVKLGDTFAQAKAKLGNPINWGIPSRHTSLAFYHIENRFLTLAIWRQPPEDKSIEFTIGTIYAIGYSEECSVLACEPMTALVIEDIRQMRKLSFLENEESDFDIDFEAQYWYEDYQMIPPTVGLMGGYFVTVIFTKSEKIIDFWFYDLSWSYMGIRMIHERDKITELIKKAQKPWWKFW